MLGAVGAAQFSSVGLVEPTSARGNLHSVYCERLRREHVERVYGPSDFRRVRSGTSERLRVSRPAWITVSRKTCFAGLRRQVRVLVGSVSALGTCVTRAACGDWSSVPSLFRPDRRQLPAEPGESDSLGFNPVEEGLDDFRCERRWPQNTTHIGAVDTIGCREFFETVEPTGFESLLPVIRFGTAESRATVAWRSGLVRRSSPPCVSTMCRPLRRGKVTGIWTTTALSSRQTVSPGSFC